MNNFDSTSVGIPKIDVLHLDIPSINFPKSNEEVKPIFDIVKARGEWMEKLYAEQEEVTYVLSKSFREDVIPTLQKTEDALLAEINSNLKKRLPNSMDLDFSPDVVSNAISSATQEISRGSDEVTSFLQQALMDSTNSDSSSWLIPDISTLDLPIVDNIRKFVSDNPAVLAGIALLLIITNSFRTSSSYEDTTARDEEGEITKSLSAMSLATTAVTLNGASQDIVSSVELDGLKQELKNKEEEIAILKRASETAASIARTEREKITKQVTSEVTAAIEKKYNEQIRQMMRPLEELKEKDAEAIKREAKILRSVKQFLVETGYMPQGLANMVLVNTIPNVLKDAARKGSASNSKEELNKVNSKLHEMELYLKEKTVENEQLKQKLLGSDETVGVQKNKENKSVVETGAISELELNVVVDMERIEIRNPTDKEIKLPEGYTLADTYPSTKVNLVLPKISIPAQKTLTVFTCPGKEAFSRPKSFRGKYIEWKTTRGDLKKSRLFAGNKSISVFLYSIDGSKA